MVGFGNELLGDDGFGVEVVRRLAASDSPAYIHTLDEELRGSMPHDDTRGLLPKPMEDRK